MPKYMIDANLPYKFSLWKSDDFIHVADIDPFLSDTGIWEYAKNNNLIIVTKDADFTHRIILASPPPKVVFLKIGNMKMRELHSFVQKIWNEIEKEVKEHKLVIVHKNYIEAY